MALLKLAGSPHEIGFKHGSEAKKKVHRSLQTYEKMFHEYSGITWQEAKEKALRHVQAIETYNANYLEEMNGLAEGAGVTFEDILALNARSEIALVTAPDGCTAFALAPPVTTKMWLAQNWDWKSDQSDSLIHLKIEQSGLPTIQMITEAGIIGKIGCNDVGVGVCLNALVTDVWEPKVPIHLGLRAILEAETMAAALAQVKQNQMASAAHFLIASKSQQMASVEVSPVYTASHEADSGVLTHTNHICSPELKRKVMESPLPNSFARLHVIDQLLVQLPGKNIQPQDLFQILSNHDNYPLSICRHEAPGQTWREKTQTVFSIVMNLTDGELTWIYGNPCEQTEDSTALT